MADQSGGAASAMASGSGAGGSILREYRKGNWTLQETMILIEAKKMDDERRLKKSAAAAASTSSEMQLTPAGSSSQEMLMMRNKPAELRWKWVEDYCWRRGCFRSQNQCNDKWDNLMRDYKKVRDYQKKLLLDQNNDAPGGGGGGGSSSAADQNVSYWNVDKSERKERGLPSNMLPTIYEALVDVVERKPAAAASSPAPITTVNTTDAIITVHNLQPSTAALSLLHQQHLNAALALPPQPPLQQPHHHIAQPPLPPPLTQPIPMYQTTTIPECLDSDTSSDSPAKRRRKDKGPEITAAAGPSASSSNEAADVVANAISKAASKISEAIQASEGRSEQRHREMLELNQRRMHQLEEVNRQGTSSLVEAINNLANSILSFAAAASNNNNNSQTPPSPPPPP